MKKIILLRNNQEAQALFGIHDKNIKEIERQYAVKVGTGNGGIKLSGSSQNVQKATVFINSLLGSIRRGERQEQGLARIQPVSPKTKRQREYVEAIRGHDIVFALGPAGTGKTYLAVWQAKEALRKAEVRRIILTRPAIEAGESLGFLPGTIYEKISPYLRPLYDALYDMMEAEVIERYIDTGIIEVAPLAYMRGRTLNDAFIILDEAQNCSKEQLKMFLTRLGFDSKAVITGDITQSDLPGGKPTGLIQAQEIFKNINGIKFIYLGGGDIVRHELVQKVIEAYDKASHKK
jgi:phosphate starvation-inducible PhoH-like protein